MSSAWYPDNYFAYIRSPQWAAVVRRYFNKHPRRCAGCPSEIRIQLHHRTYIRLEAERDSDLVPLCDTCHSMVHGIHQMTRADLDEVTDLWIRASRQTRKGDLSTRRRDALVGAQRKSGASGVSRTSAENVVHIGTFSYVAKEAASFVVWSTFDRKPKSVWRGSTRERALLVSESIDRRARARLEEAATPPLKRAAELTTAERLKLLSPPVPDTPEPRPARTSQVPTIKQQLADRFGRRRVRGAESFGYLKNMPPKTRYGDDT
jgi:hypothetical protein